MINNNNKPPIIAPIDILVYISFTLSVLISFFKSLIKSLHNNNFYHGDLKPNNIGCMIDKNKHIVKCCVFDCFTLKDISSLDENTKQSYFDKDNFTYKHYLNKLK